MSMMYPVMFGFQDPSNILSQRVKEESLLRATSSWASQIIDTSSAR